MILKSSVGLFAATVLSLSVALFAGCGGGVPDRGPTGPLSGKVTIGGKPVSSGVTVIARHKETGATASSLTNDAGEYSFPALVVGNHTIGLIPPPTMTAEMDPDAAMDAIAAGTYQAPKPVVSIPPNVQVPESSPLSATVTEAGSTSDFAL